MTSITNAALLSTSTTQGTDLWALTDTALAAVPASWTFIEDVAFTQAAVSRTARIYKCLGSQNYAGQDFFVAIIKNVTPGLYFAMRAFEGWDATNKYLLKVCVKGSLPGTAANYAASTYSFPASTNLTMADTNNYWAEPAPTLTTLTLYTVVIAVGKSFVCASTQLGGSIPTACYAGQFIPAYPDSMATYPPLYCGQLETSSSGSVLSGVSRSLRPGFSTIANMYGVSTLVDGVLWGSFSSVSGAQPEWSSGGLRGCRALLASANLSSYYASGPQAAGVRGWMGDLLVFAVGATPLLGDTVTINGTTWVKVGSSANQANDMWLNTAGTF